MANKEVGKTWQFLERASRLYRDTCPELARFLMQRQQKNAPAIPVTVLCPFCFQWRQAGEYHVRLRPKRVPSPKVRKLLRREAAHKRLGAEQTRLLQKFRRSSNVAVATCHTCNKTSRQAGVNRDFLGALPKSFHTPQSAVKRKLPLSANKTTPKPSHEKTPNRTPMSNSPELSNSSKSARGRKSVFSRLKKLLLLEDKQKCKKGSLKDFLTSL